MHLPDNTLLHGGTYRIIRFINSGGFGCTYEAEHVMLKKRVAIKEFFVKDFCNRDEQTAHVTVATQSKKGLIDKLHLKFVEEAQAIAQMQHPSIVHVSDVFEENNTAYYVMDYINGKSLSQISKEEGPMPEDRALKYILQVASALKYIHSHNRLHLDVKPANIMVGAEDCAILIDFGASKQYDEEKGVNTSTLVGKTPGYAPLEQMNNSVQTFTPATDIFALGATLYKLLTGKTPPNLSTLIEDGGVSLPAKISSKTREAIENAMQINKKSRSQSIDEWLNFWKIDTDAEHRTGDFEKDENTLILENENGKIPVKQKSTMMREKQFNHVETSYKFKILFGFTVLCIFLISLYPNCLFTSLGRALIIVLSIVSIVIIINMNNYRGKKQYKFLTIFQCVIFLVLYGFAIFWLNIPDKLEFTLNFMLDYMNVIGLVFLVVGQLLLLWWQKIFWLWILVGVFLINISYSFIYQDLYNILTLATFYVVASIIQCSLLKFIKKEGKNTLEQLE